ncbi:hypothetical protein KGB50_gp24 [Shigella phage DS8]|uniref:Uncharacterized protein n=1 Tax=Shigella phage DS8 TaxID=2565502 RepID=A0A4P8N3D2_9CAUD|nr:hypothetical protein KGB50_gp24 [Shigella phage DS8]QCQ57307.1 hypothetical protein [Shigella phage DS8]
MDIDIPDSFDDEWQREMLRNLLVKLNELDDGGYVVSDGYSLLDDAIKIVEALYEYSGD